MTDRYKLLESYINNTMSASERRQFEEKLSGDPELKSQLEYHKGMLAGFDILIENEVKNVIGNLEYSIKTKSVRINYGLVSSIAAAAVILVYFWFWGSQSLNSDEIFEKYYVYAAMDISRSDIENDYTDIELDYFSIHEKIKGGDYESALQKLQELDLSEDHYLHDNIEWLQALVSLKIEPEKARLLFLELQKKEGHKYREKIKEVCNVLKNSDTK